MNKEEPGSDYGDRRRLAGAYNTDAQTAGASLSNFAALLQANGIGTQTPTADQLNQGETALQTQGAAIPGLFQYFETMGFSDTQIRTMVQEASASTPVLPTETIDQALGDFSHELQMVGTVASALPASVLGGAKGKFTIKLANVTPATLSGRATVSLFLSSDQNYDAGDIPLGSPIVKSFKLKGEKSENIPTSVIYPGTADGKYYVITRVDSAVGQSATTSQQTINVAAPFIDLVPSFNSTPTSTESSPRKWDAQLTISNVGNISASGSLKVTLEPSSDPVNGDSNAVILDKTFRIQVKPGKSKLFNLKFVSTVPVAAGADYLHAYVSLLGNESITSTADPISVIS